LHKNLAFVTANQQLAKNFPLPGSFAPDTLKPHRLRNCSREPATNVEKAAEKSTQARI
jgi:hypothetical protein